MLIKVGCKNCMPSHLNICTVQRKTGEEGEEKVFESCRIGMNIHKMHDINVNLTQNKKLKAFEIHY